MNLPNINDVRKAMAQAEAEALAKAEAKAEAEAEANRCLPQEIEKYKAYLIDGITREGLPFRCIEPPKGSLEIIAQWCQKAGYVFGSYYRHGYRYFVGDSAQPYPSWAESK